MTTKTADCYDCEHYNAPANPGRYCLSGYYQQPYNPPAAPWNCPHWTPPTIKTLARRATTPAESIPNAERLADALNPERKLPLLTNPRLDPTR